MVKLSSSVDCEAQERKRTQNEGRAVGDEHLPEDESIAWTSADDLAPLQSLLCSLSQSLSPFLSSFQDSSNNVFPPLLILLSMEIFDDPLFLWVLQISLLRY
jgi:hypothetical protein